MATVTVTCLCGRDLTLDTALAGTSFPCPTCNRVLTVPREGAAVTRPTRPAELASTIGMPPRSQVAAGDAAAPPTGPRKRAPAWLVIALCGLAGVALLIGAPHGVVRYHRHRVARLEKQRQDLPGQSGERLKELERQVRAGQTQLTITGPAALQAGAANTYILEARDLNNEEAAAAFTIRLLDKSGKVIARQERESAGKFTYTVPLPAALKPDDQLTLEVTARRNGADTQPVSLTEKLPLERPGYSTHITTDRPLYQPGEVVAFRSLTLDRFRMQPAEEDLQLSFTITDPAGQVVFRKDSSAYVRDPKDAGRLLEGPDGRAVRGVGFGEFALPTNAPGGEYVLSVSDRRGRFAAETRRFLVNRYQAPRLHKELEFTRRSYGPGDEVLAAARVRRIEGGKPLADLPVSATIIVDGKRLAVDGSEKSDAAVSLKTDAEGAVAVRFKLPRMIDIGAASLSLQFNDGGNNESIVRPIPIVVRRLRVDFYPEGGDLVAGVPNRVYFAARTPLGKPAEMRGRVLDAKGQSVVEIRTLSDEKVPESNQGLGVFTFTPAVGQKYELQIEQPSGIPYRAELPAVRPAGVVLRVESGAASAAEPIRVDAASVGSKRRLLIAVCCRGRLVGSESVEVEAGASRAVTINPAGGSGVFRVTVYEERAGGMVPLAERLIFRHAANYLNVAVQPDKTHYVPGERVRLAVSARDEAGKPAGAIALVQVVDRASLSLADDRTRRTMPTHFLLAGEVRRPDELENADFLLSDHPLAAVTVDLLLGTQGWRRFAEQDPEQFRQRQGADADRLLAAAGQTPLRVTNRREVEIAAQPYLNEARRRTDAEFGPRLGELSIDLHDAQFAVTRWQEYAELSLIVAILVLLLVVLGAVIAAGVAGLATLERKNPGSAGTIFGLAGIGALVVVFLLFFVAFVGSRLGSSSKSTFAQVGSSIGAARMDAGAAGGNLRQMELAKGSPNPPGAPLRTSRAADTPGPRGAAEPAGPSAAEDREPATTDPAYSTGEAKAPPGESARRRYQRVRQEQEAGTASPTAPGEWSFKELERGNRTLVARSAADPLVIREYAHENQPGRATRSDFTETVFWHPVLIMPGNQDTFVNFSLSDAVTSYQALAYVHTPDGRLGAATIEFAARLPFSLDAKVPLEVTSSDELHIPLAVANDTDRRRDVHLTVDARGLTRLDGAADAQLSVDAQKRARALFRYKPGLPAGDARLVVAGRSDFFTDRLERTITVVPEGFPVAGAHSGTLSRELTGKIVLPEKITPGSLRVRAEVYPSVLADLLTGIEGMLSEPHGCFEQTSSSNYPNLLILDYLQSTNQSRPEVARRALELLERGYRRLLSFECQKPGGGREGYEWFGGFAPPHEALTAYGLMQFHDLARVYDRVDTVMVERTRQFLLGRRDSAGNFTRKTDFHSFGRVSQPVFNAYLVWALTESEADADLNREVQWLVGEAERNDDPYFLALVANSLLLRNNKAEGARVLDKLVKLQNAAGFLPGRESIVGSQERDRHIEATSLAVLAWLKAEQPIRYHEPLQKAVRWLTAQRGGHGGFGSTQATVLALKALSRLARDSRRLSDASVVLSINGNRVLQQKVAAASGDALVLELSERDLAKLKAGANDVRLELAGEGELPARISWSYRTVLPPSAEDCPIRLTTSLDRDRVGEGDTVRLTARVENTSKEAQSMTVAIVGLPAGLSVPEDLKQLSELTKPRTPLAGSETPGAATVSYFEIRGREIVLYWRGLAAGQRVEVPIDLIARTPGSYRGPASRAYLYYGADARCWVAPLSAVITAR